MSPNRAKTASAFTDYKGQGVVVLICFGLPHYPEQGAHQAETTRSRPFATPKSSFPGCFPSEKVVLFIAIKRSFLHPSGEFQRAASKTNFHKDDERKKDFFFNHILAREPRNELPEHLQPEDVPLPPEAGTSNRGSDLHVQNVHLWC